MFTSQPIIVRAAGAVAGVALFFGGLAGASAAAGGPDVADTVLDAAGLGQAPDAASNGKAHANPNAFDGPDNALQGIENASATGLEHAINDAPDDVDDDAADDVGDDAADDVGDDAADDVDDDADDDLDDDADAGDDVDDDANDDADDDDAGDDADDDGGDEADEDSDEGLDTANSHAPVQVPPGQ